MKKFFCYLSMSLSLLWTAAAFATIYEVGPGQAYTELGQVPWLTLAAGDEVHIHWRSDPYRSKIGIRGRGTAAQPIIITGIPGGADGKQLPVITGENATTDAQFNGFFSIQYDEGLGLIMIHAPWGTKPGYITIENLKLTGTKPGNTYTGMDGKTYNFWDFTSAIVTNPVEHFILRGCEITDNSLGLFVMSKGDEPTTSRDILVEYNRIYGNGVENSYTEHNVYTECSGIVFQYNYFGALRPNAQGSTLKDRSAGTVVRYNWFESSARTIDIVEAEDGYPILKSEPNYLQTYIYGNIIVNDISQTVSSANMIHYGYDNVSSCARTGPHYFYYNTVVVTGSATPAWKISLFQCGTDWGSAAWDNTISLDLRNNIFYWNPATIQSQGVGGGMGLLDEFGTANLKDANWISTNWQNGQSGFVGTVTVTGSLLTGTSPGFVNETGRDFSLATAAPPTDQAVALPVAITSVQPLLNMYKPDADGVARAVVGAAMDLGAFEGNGAGAGHVVFTSGTPTPTPTQGISLTITVTPTFSASAFDLQGKHFIIFPNPARKQATIIIDLKNPAFVQVDIFNLAGKRITSLKKPSTGGRELMFWNTSNVAAGVYFGRVLADNKEIGKFRLGVVK
jgi:hypothetical protein